MSIRAGVYIDPRPDVTITDMWRQISIQVWARYWGRDVNLVLHLEPIEAQLRDETDG